MIEQIIKEELDSIHGGYTNYIDIEREEAEATVNKIIKRMLAANEAYKAGYIKATEEYKQFILNILDGIDIADEQVGVTGGTKAIRLAIQSRI